MGIQLGRQWLPEDQHNLMSAINQQPMSVAIEADQSAFQSYSGGILSEGCGTNLDHGVPAVGYDIAEGYYLCVFVFYSLQGPGT